MKIRELMQNEAHVGSTQTLKGWLRTVRIQKNVAFLQINDGSTLAGMQVVVNSEKPEFSHVNQMTTGSSIEVVGVVAPSPSSGQALELHASQITLIGACDPETYPLQKKRHSLEFLRSIAHLRPRSNTIGAVARLRHAMSLAIHRYFDEKGFLYLHTPLITTCDCEGAGQMFTVTTLTPEQMAKKPLAFEEDFFGKHAHLTVSGQLNGEIYACAMGDIYTFGPTFRAENSNTSRHLAEFWMVEPEMAFTDLQGNIDCAYGLLQACAKTALERCHEDISFFDQYVRPGVRGALEKFIGAPLRVITYTEAVDLLKKSKKSFEYPVEWGLDLQSEHERYLCEELFQGPVVVINYPKQIKSFYMRANEDGKTVAAMDILVPQIGEIIGGSQREERYDNLIAKIQEMGLQESDYWWYLDLRRYGSVPHSGFGLGFERLIQWISGIENIRDAIAFPRYPKHADF